MDWRMAVHSMYTTDEQAYRTYDLAQLYFGRDYAVTDLITIQQPLLGDIVNYGESSYFSMIHSLTATPSDMKGFLAEIGYEYDEITDFFFFALLSHSFPYEQTSMIIKGIDFSTAQFLVDEEQGVTLLYDPTFDSCLDEDAYFRMVGYLRILHGLSAKREFATNKYTRDLLIEESKDAMRKSMLNRNTQHPSILVPMISSMVNSAGFKYNTKEVLDLTLYEFMDSVKRISAIESAKALQSGCYSGNVDMSKLDKKQLDWMRDLTVLERHHGKELTAFTGGVGV